MMKASGVESVRLHRILTKALFTHERYILDLYKGKGETFDRGNYHGLKLTDQVMKVIEHLLEVKIREISSFDEILTVCAQQKNN